MSEIIQQQSNSSQLQQYPDSNVFSLDSAKQCQYGELQNQQKMEIDNNYEDAQSGVIIRRQFFLNQELNQQCYNKGDISEDPPELINEYLVQIPEINQKQNCLTLQSKINKIPPSKKSKTFQNSLQMKKTKNRKIQKISLILFFLSRLKKKQQNYKNSKQLSHLQLNLINDVAANNEEVILFSAFQNADKQNMHSMIENPSNCRKYFKIKKYYYTYLLFAKTKMNIFKKKISTWIDLQIPIIPFNSCFLTYWNLITYILTIFNIIFLSFSISFDFVQDYRLSIIIFFLADILVKLNTSYLMDNVHIVGHKMLVLNYLNNYFFLDLVSILIPLAFSSFSQFLCLLFITRFIQIQQFIWDKCLLFIHQKNLFFYFQYLALIINLFLYLHLLACSWLYIQKEEYKMSQQGWLSQNNLQNQSISSIYLHSFYEGIYIITITQSYNFQSEYQKLFKALASLSALMMISYIINKIIQISTTYREQTKQITTLWSQLNKFNDRNNTEKKAQLIAAQQINNLNSDDCDSNKLQCFENQLENLPQCIKQPIISNAKFQMLQQIEILKRNFTDNFLRRLSASIKEVIYNRNEIIINQQEIVEPSLYLIISGEADVFLKLGNNSMHKSHHLCKLSQYCYFGEHDFFSQTFEASQSIKASSDIHLLQIKLRDFLIALKDYQSDREKFCFIRDQINMKEDQHCVQFKCYFCQELTNHYLNDCPLIFTSKKGIFDQITIKQHYTSKFFIRNKQRKKYQCLPNLKIIQDLSLQYKKIYLHSNSNLDKVTQQQDYQTEINNEIEDDCPQDQQSQGQKQVQEQNNEQDAKSLIHCMSTSSQFSQHSNKQQQQKLQQEKLVQFSQSYLCEDKENELLDDQVEEGKKNSEQSLDKQVSDIDQDMKKNLNNLSPVSVLQNSPARSSLKKEKKLKKEQMELMQFQEQLSCMEQQDSFISPKIALDNNSCMQFQNNYSDSNTSRDFFQKKSDEQNKTNRFFNCNCNKQQNQQCNQASEVYNYYNPYDIKNLILISNPQKNETENEEINEEYEFNKSKLIDFKLYYPNNNYKIVIDDYNKKNSQQNIQFQSVIKDLPNN